jgi:hypothetical protein
MTYHMRRHPKLDGSKFQLSLLLCPVAISLLFLPTLISSFYTSLNPTVYTVAFAFPPFNATSNLNSSFAVSNDSTTSTAPAVQTNKSSFLKVIVLVKNTGSASAKPSDFTVQVYTDPPVPANNEAHPDHFYGSDKGTISVIIPGTYVVGVNDMINNIPYSIVFSGNCVSKGLNTAEVALNPGDKHTCTITASPANF